MRLFLLFMMRTDHERSCNKVRFVPYRVLPRWNGHWSMEVSNAKCDEAGKWLAPKPRELCGLMFTNPVTHTSHDCDLLQESRRRVSTGWKNVSPKAKSSSSVEAVAFGTESWCHWIEVHRMASCLLFSGLSQWQAPSKKPSCQLLVRKLKSNWASWVHLHRRSMLMLFSFWLHHVLVQFWFNGGTSNCTVGTCCLFGSGSCLTHARKFNGIFDAFLSNSQFEPFSPQHARLNTCSALGWKQAQNRFQWCVQHKGHGSWVIRCFCIFLICWGHTIAHEQLWCNSSLSAPYLLAVLLFSTWSSFSHVQSRLAF